MLYCSRSHTIHTGCSEAENSFDLHRSSNYLPTSFEHFCCCLNELQNNDDEGYLIIFAIVRFLLFDFIGIIVRCCRSLFCCAQSKVSLEILNEN